MDPPRYAFIDALRGWAILLVVLLHASQGHSGVDALISPVVGPAMSLPDGLGAFSSAGLYGVQLFFVVSALSLTLSWWTKNVSTPLAARDYFIRRFFRVAPLFYVAIAFYLVLYGWGPRAFAPKGIGIADVASTVAFLHTWRWNSMNSVVPGDWSLGVLAMFYLVFPVLLMIAQSRWQFAILTLLGVVWTQLLQGYTLAHSINTGPLGMFGFPAEGVAFLFGLWAAIAILALERRRPLSLSPAMGQGLVLVLFLGLVVVLPFVHLPTWLVIYRIQFAALAAILCVALRCFPVKLIVNPMTIRLGRVSFSMFVFHFALLAPALRVAEGVADKFDPAHSDVLVLLIEYPILVTAAFALASVTFAVIEQPSIHIGRRLTGLNRASHPR